jgi:hypothetical protein
MLRISSSIRAKDYDLAGLVGYQLFGFFELLQEMRGPNEDF